MLPDPFRLVSRQMRTDRGMVTDIAASKQLKVIESVVNRSDACGSPRLLTRPYEKVWRN